ncbi:PAS domain-containing protein [Maribacter sp. ANRC-HE7]|uniref:histidine kinase n=1 Tax=Maribacter aquimaris TaxID=2737171 RepID=A0ABR7V8L3_9FLAO|nr:PAS domain-containing sensor histidine kinase [Maribacter aquimaris]MBD0779493.1 PAS domain-containing protein [Maribacter aquimaris]
METRSFNFLFKESIYPMAVVDNQMRFLNHSKLWLKDLDIADPDIIGKSFYDVVPNVTQEIKNIHQFCLEHKTKLNKNQKIIQPDGRVQWLNWQIKGWNNKENNQSGLLIVAEDITTDKKNEKLLLNIQNIANIGGWEFDFISNKAFLSDTLKQLHGLPLDYEINLEKGLNFYKEGEHRRRITQVVNEAMVNGTPWDIEIVIVTTNGDERWVRSIGECEIVANKCIRIYGTLQDIDQKKRIEIHNKEISERLTMATTDATNLGIWEYNIPDAHLVWDDNLYRIYGVAKDNFSETIDAWEAIIHPEDKLRCHNVLERAISEDKKYSLQFKIFWPNGEIRHIRTEFTTSRYQKGKPIRLIGAAWDNTESKVAEQKLKDLLEITNGQNESLLNFAHIVSHNLRSHSSNLSMLTSFLNTEENEHEKKNLIKMLTDASISLNDTVTHLSEVVHVKTNSVEKMKKIKLRQAVKNVENNISALLKEKEAVCNIDIDKSLFIQAVPAYLDSIFLNLFTNSLKYCSPKRTPIINVAAKQNNNKVSITFSDNGQGIDLDKHGKKIFGMYKTFHRHKDSKGIGLFITKNQIEAMKGSIEVESVVDKGTTFTLTLRRNI